MANITHWIWHIGVIYILYGFLLVVSLRVAYLIMMESLKVTYSDWNYKYRIRRIKKNIDVKESQVSRNPLVKHISLLIRTTSDNRNELDAQIFILFSGIFGFSMFLLFLIALHDLVVAAIFGLLLSTIPYIFLRLKLNKIRYLMSLEFLSIVQRLTQNYSANQQDMYYALVETQKQIKNEDLRKVTIRLISDLQVSRSEKELKESVQVFTYTANTNWSKRLGSIILKAYLYNEKVSNALMVLTKQMEDTEEMLEEEKSQMQDSIYDGFITAPLFIGSLILGYYSSGAQDWFSLQFEGKWNLFLFCLCLVGVIFSIIISIFLKSPKNDL